MADLYIYYKVRDENARSLEVRVRAMQHALASMHGVVGQLKRRPESKDGMQTWMEVYPATDRGFEAVLLQAVCDARLQGLIEDARHSEIFVDIVTCV
jgi:hypothetical protein